MAVGLLTCSVYAQSAEQNLENLNPATARAYKAYVMTFKWPSNASSEAVSYETVKAAQELPSFNPGLSRSLRVNGSPFEQFRNALDSRTTLLTNNEWTLIFPKKGTSFHKRIQGNNETNGIPEFKGAISFKLERYLETNAHFQHYRFERSDMGDSDAPQAQVLSLTLANKTASKKLNYIDHPVIGTLIYFEPIALEDAIDDASGR